MEFSCFVFIVFVYSVASKSRAGGRVYIEYFDEKDTITQEGKGIISNELWTGRRVFDQWFI